MKYEERQKIKEKHSGEKYIIDRIYRRETPVGNTVFFEIRSRKKQISNMHLTEWSLDTYFELIS